MQKEEINDVSEPSIIPFITNVKDLIVVLEEKGELDEMVDSS